MVVSLSTILVQLGGHVYYGAMALAGHILYTNTGAQDHLMQTLTEPSTDIAILISPKSSVGGECIDWASDNDELVKHALLSALLDEDKDLGIRIWKQHHRKCLCLNKLDTRVVCRNSS